jgi:DNA-binding response OmpR family regulator
MSKKILLIEDDNAISGLYQLKLRASDYDVISAENGLEALESLKVFVPDVILLDLLMPKMNGEVFLQKMRANIKFAKIPVIILTNLSREEAPKTLWHHGISAYYIKAHNTPKELVEVIKKILHS